VHELYKNLCELILEEIRNKDEFLDSDYVITEMHKGLDRILNDKIYNFTYLISNSEKFKLFRKSLTAHANRLVENYIFEKQRSRDRVNTMIEECNQLIKDYTPTGSDFTQATLEVKEIINNTIKK